MPSINRGAVRAIAGYVQGQREKQEEAYKSDQEFQQRLMAAGIQSGRLEPVIQGGRITGVQPAQTDSFDPASLQPGQTYSQKVAGGTLVSRGPTTPREVDPLVQLQREIAAQNALQAIEQRNVLAPVAAMADREAAFPRPKYPFGIGGGYTDNPPSWIQKTGAMLSGSSVSQRPQAPAVSYLDTTPYRNRLTQLQTGGRAAIAPSAPPTSAPMDTGMQEEVGDLVAAIQQRVVQTRAQAIQVIQAAGLDPSDPAFAPILSQLQ